MSKYNPLIHHRRSIRLKGYDYAQKGAYFVTFCVKNRKHFFGKIENNEMVFNDAGLMINEWWEKLPEKFSDIQLGAYITMPNHFHGIIINDGHVGANSVGATPRGRPQSSDNRPILGDHNGSTNPPILGDHMGSPLHSVVMWFKTMTTNMYIRGVKNHDWERFDGKLWQRDYYEHIIRNEQSYDLISNYIVTNPAKWDSDTLR